MSLGRYPKIRKLTSLSDSIRADFATSFNTLTSNPFSSGLGGTVDSESPEVEGAGGAVVVVLCLDGPATAAMVVSVECRVEVMAHR